MRAVPQKDRIAFWSFTSASSSFSAASSCLRELRSKDALSSPDVRYATACAFVVFYGRPFKQKKMVRLIEELVPKKYLSLHKHLLTLRDKTYAHVDPDGPSPESGLLNKPKIQVRSGGFSVALNYFTLDAASQDSAADLLSELEKKCRYHSIKIWQRYMRRSPPSDGDYEVRLESADAPLLKQWEPMK